jgi:predicted XRE-type DNA-binding protein
MAKKWKDLMADLPADRRARIKHGTAKLLVEMPLHELRRARQLSQEQLAEVLGEKQPSISKLEQRTDMYISTLRRYRTATPLARPPSA